MRRRRSAPTVEPVASLTIWRRQVTDRPRVQAKRSGVGGRTPSTTVAAAALQPPLCRKSPDVPGAVDLDSDRHEHTEEKSRRSPSQSSPRWCARIPTCGGAGDPSGADDLSQDPAATAKRQPQRYPSTSDQPVLRLHLPERQDLLDHRFVAFSRQRSIFGNDATTKRTT